MSGPVRSGSSLAIMIRLRMLRRVNVWLILVVLSLVLIASSPLLLRIPVLHAVYLRLAGRATVADRLREYGPVARTRLTPYFEGAGVAYPPSAITIATFKNEDIVEIYAPLKEQQVFIRSYPVLAGSGVLGPKLRRGDIQVPEGIYRVVYLNPNSRFHLSLRLDYPNGIDQEWAQLDGRTDLGSDIMIHGSAVSIGCIAIGDEAAEDLFVLAADMGVEDIKVVISPVDFRREELPAGYQPVRPWVPALYGMIRQKLAELPAPTR